MSNANLKSIPCDTSVNKHCNKNDSKLLKNDNLYRNIVGSLIYLMVCTKPDICFSITKLSQKLAQPTYADLNLAKHVLKYLTGTKVLKM